MIFNKPVKTKEAYLKILNKVREKLGYYKHPKNLTQQDRNWLKKNIKQYNEKVLNKIIKNSVLSDKPKK
jgi:hypothetical protein